MSELILFEFEPGLTNEQFHKLKYIIKEFCKTRKIKPLVYTIIRE